MSDETKNPGIENGWAIQVAFSDKVRPMGVSQTPSTGYHAWTPSKAVFFGATAESSPRIAVHMAVVKSQEGAESSEGMEQQFSFFLSFLDPNFTARAEGKGRTAEQIADELKRDEARVKAYLVAIGHSLDAVVGYTGELSAPIFLSSPEGNVLVAHYERALRDEDEDKWYGPYWDFIAPDKVEAAMAGKLAHKLVNEERKVGTRGSARVQAGGATVGAKTPPNLRAPIGLPAGAAAPIQTAQTVPTAGNGLNAAPATSQAASKVLGALGALRGLGQPAQG